MKLWKDRNRLKRVPFWPDVRFLLLLGITLVSLGLTFALPAMPQDGGYHSFADRRVFAGVPHSLNVLSNLPFAIVGGVGVAGLIRRRRAPLFLDSRESLPYFAFFAGIFLVALGSAYYHLFPSNQSLVWDRLPISIVLVAFACSQLAERVSPKAGAFLLGPLIGLGIGSVVYWRLTELLGQGDLRPYGFIRFFPMVLVPFLILMFPTRYTGSGRLVLALVLFAASSLLEALDEAVLQVGGFVSGHTLKHLLAALSAYLIWQMLRLRRPFRPPDRSPELFPHSSD
ncbi:MAG: alkaline phytoceramidase [Acidobacteria bacterium]|nr:MAG: alkaline phytoceramidase [Acidobacteriota bacterium]